MLPFCRARLSGPVFTTTTHAYWCGPCGRVIAENDPLTTATHRLGDWVRFVTWQERTARAALAADLGRYLAANRGRAGERDPVVLALDPPTSPHLAVEWEYQQRHKRRRRTDDHMGRLGAVAGASEIGDAAAL